jgi:cyanophycinase
MKLGRARHYLIVAVVMALLGSACASAPSRSDGGSEADRERPRGSLVIVGGGPRPESVMRRFLDLAGGPGRARIVVFPMATASAAEAGDALANELRRMGAIAWSLNLTRDDAMRESTTRGLDSVTGIWFAGGDQNRIMAAIGGTPVASAIRARYAAGAVVGGTSAGAAVMTTPMITGSERRPGGARPDTTQSWITIAADNVDTAEGLALLDAAIVDQHFLRRRRHNRLMSLVLEHPTRIGVGIDESTALVVEPNGWWSVIGESAVIIFDARAGQVTAPGSRVLGGRDLRTHVLPPGSRFEPRSGRVELGG